MAYRLEINVRYSSVSNANSALSSINTALSNAGRPESASRSGSDVTLIIVDIPDQATAESLRDSLNSAWSSVARSYGKVSLVKTDDVNI